MDDWVTRIGHYPLISCSGNKGDEPEIDSGYWVVSEGCRTVDDKVSPLETPSLLVYLDNMAMIQEVICLPAEADDIQVRYGFEGVPADGHNVLVSCRT
jgi:hypothetical protein